MTDPVHQDEAVGEKEMRPLEPITPTQVQASPVPTHDTVKPLQVPADYDQQRQQARDQPKPDTAATHPVYYDAVTLVDDNPPRLDFIRALTAQPPPPEFRAFRRQVEDVSRLIRILFQDDPKRRKAFFLQLHLTADSGLRGANSSIEVGLDNLQDVKNAIADAYTSVRGKLWWWNLGMFLASLAVAVAGIIAMNLRSNHWLWETNKGDLWEILAAVVLFLPLGALAGLFTEFLFRVNDDIPYEQLRAINPGRWKPFERALNTMFIAGIFAGILAADIIKVGVSNLLLNDFVSKPYLLLVIGFVTGFAFPYVRDLVQQVRPVSRDTRP